MHIGKKFTILEMVKIITVITIIIVLHLRKIGMKYLHHQKMYSINQNHFI